MIKEGNKAPVFSLPDQDGKKVSLSDLRGKNIVLYFYPKDNTSGCTKEACQFRDAFPRFKGANALIIGISPDSVESHKKFEKKYELPFTLLSDEKKLVLEKYEVWKEKSMYGRKYMGVERTTFIIDKEGKIRNIFNKVKVSDHEKQVLQALKELE